MSKQLFLSALLLSTNVFFGFDESALAASSSSSSAQPSKPTQNITLLEDMCKKVIIANNINCDTLPPVIRSQIYKEKVNRVLLDRIGFRSRTLYDKTNGRRNRVFSAQFSHDNTHIVSASNFHTVRIWDTESGRCLHALQGHTDRVNAAQFNHDDTCIASASNDNTVRIWNLKSGQCLHTLQGHTGSVQSAQFNHNSTCIASASYDTTVRIWDTNSGQCLHTLKDHTGLVQSALFNHNNTRIASASNDTTVRIWDTNSGQCLHTLQGHAGLVQSALFNHDSTRIISASDLNEIRIWDVKSGQCLQRLKNGPSLCLDWIFLAQFNYDGVRFVTASPNGTVRILEDYKTILCNDEIIELLHNAIPSWQQNKAYVIDQEFIDRYRSNPIYQLLRNHRLFTTKPTALSLFASGAFSTGIAATLAASIQYLMKKK